MFNFKNVGGKLKIIARVLFYLALAGSIIIGIYELFEKDSLAICLAWIIGGSIGSWIEALLLYGFGELVENSRKQTFALAKIYIAENGSD